MLVLTIRTDKPEAEIGLYRDDKELVYKTWQAHRQLAETIHRTIQEVVESQGLTLHDIEGVVCFEGPGSFTGLRIGLTVGNALAEGLRVPIVATQGEQWRESGLRRLAEGHDDKVVLPLYGEEVRITTQKK